MVKVIGVRRNLRRRRLTRRRMPPKYSGQKGWNWFEANVSNTFTTIDNAPSNVIKIADGFEFSALFNGTDNDLGNHNERMVVFRTMRIQMLVSWFNSDEELFPLAAYDVGIVKFETVVDDGPLTLDLQGISQASNNRVVWHQRVWAARQAALADSEATSSAYGVNPALGLIDVYLKPQVPLAQRESLGLVLSQCDSELYTDGSAGTAQGYIKSWVQMK